MRLNVGGRKAVREGRLFIAMAAEQKANGAAGWCHPFANGQERLIGRDGVHSFHH
jgi:hypothetical protein